MSSGGGGGSTFKQALGLTTLVAEVGAAPFTGGVSLAGVPGSLAVLGSGASQAGGEAARAASRLQNNLLQPIKNTIPLPTLSDDAVQAARNNQLLALQSRSGRASTLLSTTQGTKTNFGS